MHITTLPHGTPVVKDGSNISARVRGTIESYTLAGGQSFSDVFLKEIVRSLAAERSLTER